MPNRCAEGGLMMFNLDDFIKTYVTKRSDSMFETDIDSYREDLSDRRKKRSCNWRSGQYRQLFYSCALAV